MTVVLNGLSLSGTNQFIGAVKLVMFIQGSNLCCGATYWSIAQHVALASLHDFLILLEKDLICF